MKEYYVEILSRIKITRSAPNSDLAINETIDDITYLPEFNDDVTDSQITVIACIAEQVVTTEREINIEN